MPYYYFTKSFSIIILSSSSKITTHNNFYYQHLPFSLLSSSLYCSVIWNMSNQKYIHTQHQTWQLNIAIKSSRRCHVSSPSRLYFYGEVREMGRKRGLALLFFAAHPFALPSTKIWVSDSCCWKGYYYYYYAVDAHYIMYNDEFFFLILRSTS